jgi:CO/xanthine dehydrogenase Mo-binding subunit
VNRQPAHGRRPEADGNARANGPASVRPAHHEPSAEHSVLSTQHSALAPPVGAPRPRVEGRAKVTGAERYAADYTPPGTLWGKVLRSPHPHARIVRIDTRAAAALPGVVAVLTAADLPPDTRVGRQLRDLPVLAGERVRFVGDKVAVVAAANPDVAEEALTRIEVEYEPLPAVFDPDAAIQPDAPRLHDPALIRAWATPRQTVPDLPNTCAYEIWRRGDVAAGFAAADLVLEETYRWPTQHQVYLEPHACLVLIAADGQVHVWASNKAPYLLRRYLATCLGLPEARFVVYALPVGGDFGGKGSAMDVPLAYFLAARTGRPVKLVMSYAEELAAGNPRHGATIRVRLGATRDGRLTACQTRILYNGGAYGAFKPTANLMLRGAEKGAGPYRLPHLQIDAYVVYTNTVPGGHMRAPGMVQTVFAVESLVDAACRRLGLDPFAFRRLNVVGDGEHSPAGERYRDVRAQETLAAAERAGLDQAAVDVASGRREAADDGARARREPAQGEYQGWHEPPPGVRVARRESSSGTRAVASADARLLRGRGVAIANKHPRGGGQHARLIVDGDGTVTLVTATPETGTGLHTVLRQIVAAELGLPETAIAVRLADTHDFPFDEGVGGSRLTQMLGAAFQSCARAARQALEPCPAAAGPRERLEPTTAGPPAVAGPDKQSRLAITGLDASPQPTSAGPDDRAQPAAGPQERLQPGMDAPNPSPAPTAPSSAPSPNSWRVAAARAVAAHDGPLVFDADYESVPFDGRTAFHVHVAEVAVDPETGQVTVERLIAAEDVGVVLNPLTHQGQIDGNLVQALSAALMEDLDVRGGQLTALHLGDYKIATIADVPPLVTALVESPTGPGPYHAKSVGEGPNTPTAAAIANAVYDACGVRIADPPITAEKVWRGLRAGARPPAGATASEGGPA